MLNLKDTDIDDLFRRASDKYPLRTDSADWDKMAAALEKDPTPSLTGGEETGDGRRKRRSFWLLLLLPLAGAGYYAWHRTGNGLTHSGNVAVVASRTGQRMNPTENAVQRPGPDEQTGKGTKGVAGQSPADEGAVPGGHVAESRPASHAGLPVANTNNGKNSGAAGELAARTGVGERGTPVGQDPEGTTGTNKARKTRAGEQRITGAGKEQMTRTGEEQVTGTGKEQVTGAGKEQMTGTGEQRVTGTGAQLVKDAGEAPVTGQTMGADRRLSEASNPQWAEDMELERIARDFHLSVNVAEPPAAKANIPAKQKTNPARSSNLYAGVFGAPDISTVRMQAIKGVGTTFGILLGYAFNSRWSIETGAYQDRKKYYTQGEYFNTKNVRLPYNSELLNVDGTCNMWEIPLNVRYTLNPKGKTRWFVTGGLSTYLMSSERYTYAYEKYTSGGNWASDSSWNIKRPSQYPFSIVNLSAGFEQRLGRVGDLRVEPYVRLPLTGMGTGKLPIMSGGVSIGITRRLW